MPAYERGVGTVEAGTVEARTVEADSGRTLRITATGIAGEGCKPVAEIANTNGVAVIA